MNECDEHGCNKPGAFCAHLRQDGVNYGAEELYCYMVTYVGGYAVLTTNANYGPEEYATDQWVTLVVCVGDRAIGEYYDDPYAVKRIVHQEYHYDWDYVIDWHKSTVIGLENKLIKLDA